jgi:hypothetical protein
MKLDEWKMWKNKTQRERGRCKKNLEKESQDLRELAPRREPNSYVAPGAAARLAEAAHIEQEPPLHARNQYSEESALSTCLLNDVDWSFEEFIELPGEHVPLVDPSFRFSRTRTENESLEMLANSPELAEQAFEILLINWNPGIDYMQYAMSFLEEQTYCSSILTTNSIQTNRSHGTSLFDLIDQNVPKTQRKILTKAFLRADLATQTDLPGSGQLLPWAEIWRKASKSSNWESGRLCLMEFKTGLSPDIHECALMVVAEYFLGQHKAQIENWRTKRGQQRDTAANILETWRYPEEHRNHYLAILNDCRHRRLDLDSSWYMYLLEIIEIHADYINLTKWRESGSKVLV